MALAIDDPKMRRLLAILTVLVVAALPSAIAAAASETRVALVIGNAAYKANRLATPANDAALIAQALQSAGFKVTAARDLTGDRLRQVFRDFADSLNKTGPDTVVVVYFAGCALQLEGENYLLPIDAEIGKPADLSEQALRMSDQVRALAALHLKASFVVVDGARPSPAFTSAWRPASGLAWTEPEANMLIAFNAAPGTVSRDLSEDTCGVYARALAEMIREDSQPPASLFDRVRLRVSDVSKGAQVPWHVSRIQHQFAFRERGPDVSPRADSWKQVERMRSQPLRGLGVRDAYFIALLRDTFAGYTEFLANHWNDPLSKRVRALLAARRESITWRRTYQANVPSAYWTYLERYPRGSHAADVRTLLVRLGAPISVPSKFARTEYDVPGPLPDEIQYIERTMLVLDDPEFALEPPPPLPAYFLAPAPPELWNLPRPAALSDEREVPVVKVVPQPADVSMPAGVVAESKSVAFGNFRKEVPIRGAIEIPAGGETNVIGPSTVQPLETNNPKERAGSSTAAAPPPQPALQPQPESSKAISVERATTARLGAEPSPLSTEGQPPAYAPLIVAPLAPGQLRRTQGAQGNSGAIPLPVPRPTSRKLRSAMPAPQTTGSVPVLSSSSVNSASQPISAPKPAPRAALAPKLKPVAGTAQPQPPLRSKPSTSQLNKRALPPRVVDTDSVKPAGSPYKPPKPCVIVDGKLICG